MAERVSPPPAVYRGFAKSLNVYADWCTQNRPDIKTATVAARTKTVRRALKLKSHDPLGFRGLTLKCIGSKAERQNNWSSEPA